MKHSWYNRFLVIVIIIMFIGVSSFQSTTVGLNIDISNNEKLLFIPYTISNTIYVDDDNIEGPWDGTLEHPYQCIKDGVDNASQGDTVYVFNGTYVERVKIYTSINLIGENKNTTIIDADHKQSAVRLEANNIIVSGFTLRNSGPEEWHDSGAHLGTMYNRADYCNIQGNIIIDNFDGIYALFSTKNIFKNNIILNNKHNGITLHGSSGGENKFLNNTIINNSNSGIFIYEPTDHLIYGNVIINNGNYGIMYSSGCTLIRNIIKGHIYGLCDGGAKSRLYLNTIEDNKYGVYTHSKRSIYVMNNFIGNEYHATFQRMFRSLGNSWSKNYWEGYSPLKPKEIRGMVAGFRKIEYDWEPAKEPYNIYEEKNYNFLFLEKFSLLNLLFQRLSIL